MVALKGVLIQALDIIDIWKASAVDGMIWICTYLTVIVVEIEYGLLAGIIVSVVSIILKGAKVKLDPLQSLPNTELYVEEDKLSKVRKLFLINFVKRNLHLLKIFNIESICG